MKNDFFDGISQSGGNDGPTAPIVLWALFKGKLRRGSAVGKAFLTGSVSRRIWSRESRQQPVQDKRDGADG